MPSEATEKNGSMATAFAAAKKKAERLTLPKLERKLFDRQELLSPEIASSGAASTAFIEVFFNDAVPVLAAKDGIRLAGCYFVDDSCLSCKGSGGVPCPNHSCQQGTISQKSSITRIIGFGEYAREVQIPTFNRVDCKDCVAGAVTCPACGGSGKARN